MQLHNFNLFPTEIYSFKFSPQEIQPLLDEVSLKEKQIKKVSKYFNQMGGINDYHTDFANPVKLQEYEKLMMMLGNFFMNKNKTFNIVNYWTAYYGNKSYHDTHTHHDMLKNNLNNYSSVLYLTNGGGTKFFSSNYTSSKQEELVISKVGKIIFFPSNLLHSGINDKSGERIIISSNVEMYETS